MSTHTLALLAAVTYAGWLGWNCGHPWDEKPWTFELTLGAIMEIASVVFIVWLILRGVA